MAIFSPTQFGSSSLSTLAGAVDSWQPVPAATPWNPYSHMTRQRSGNATCRKSVVGDALMRTSLFLVLAPVVLLVGRARWRSRRHQPRRGRPHQQATQGPKIIGTIFNPGAMADGPRFTPEQDQTRQRILQNITDFKMKPRDVKAFLDRFVIQQNDAKRVLSVAFCDHYNWARRCVETPELRNVNYAKPNMLILGPTGSGKTYLVRTLAKMLGVPFVKADATKFSETGIVGEDAEDVVRSLIEQAGGDAELAQYGMIYIDEVDKIANSGRAGGTGSWSGRQVQSNFLKIMEDTEVSLKTSMQASISSMFNGGGSTDASIVSTKFMLFIFSGAFNSINDLVKDRVGTQKMGFLVYDEADAGAGGANEHRVRLTDKVNSSSSRSYLHLAETSDYIAAGLEPEFVGRVPVRVAVDALDAQDLYRILTEAEDSILKQYKKEFSSYGVDLTWEPAALRCVAELAVEEKTGARALATVLERKLRSYKFELPSTPCKVLTLTEGLITEPEGTLNAMLSSAEFVAADLQRWIDAVEVLSNVRVDIVDAVRSSVAEECLASSLSASVVLDRRFQDTGVVDALREINRATDGQVGFFTITLDMYERPEEWRRSLKLMSA